MATLITKNLGNAIRSHGLAAILLVATFALLVTLTEFNHVAVYATLVASLVVLFCGLRVFEEFEKNSRELMVKSLLRAGKGLSSRGLKVLKFSLRLLVALTVLFAGFTAMHTLIVGFKLEYALLTLTTGVATLLLYLMPKLLVDFWSSQRRVGVEVELPYLLILFRVMSSLRLPLYDMFTTLENSVALPASAREVRFARKVATLTSTSFLSAIDIVCANHPSEKIRELFRRVVLAAISMGDVREVVERVFDNVYTWFESRVAGLLEKFTIIVGSALFAYLFIPVVIVAIAPVVGGSVPLVVGLTLSAQVFTLFLLYGLITSFYPSSLIVKSSKTLLAASTISLSASLVLLLYITFSHVAKLPKLEDYALSLTLLALLTPALVISERELKRVNLYDTFVKMASDALLLAASTGENVASVLERTSKKYGKSVTRLTKSILISYLSEPLRKAIVVKAPSTYHASFLETLIVTLRLGSTPDMMKAFSSSYEKLNALVSRVRGFAKTLEVLMIGLSAIIGGFLAFIDRTYKYVVSLFKVTGFPGAFSALFFYDPATYSLLNALTLLSLFLVSLFIGKIRGGSIAFCFRTAALMFILYTIFKYAFSLLAL